MTKTGGQVSVEFYTSDEATDYTIRVAGMTGKGEKIAFSGTISVR